MNRILRSFLILLIAGTSSTVLYAEDDVIEEIVVTGTRIKRSNLESSAPLTVIDSADLLATGTTNVAEYINKMPQSVATLNSSNTVFHSAVSGINVTDLRLLGEDRTLVLVNGRRFVSGMAPGSGYAVDLNAFPTSTIDRIEILSGGVSAIYGSEAIAGVVNIITKQDFEGVSVNVQSGETNHGGSTRNDVDVMIGGQFGDRGHGWIAFGYSDDNGLKSTDRDFSSLDLVTYDEMLFTPDTPKHWGFLGSSFGPAGSYAGVLGTGTPLRPGVDDQANSDLYNRSSARTLSIPTERRFAAANLSYDVNERTTAWMELNWSLVETRSIFEPTPLDLYDVVFDADKFASAGPNPVNGLRFCDDPNDDGDMSDAVDCPPGHDIATSLLMPQLLKDTLLSFGLTDLNQIGVNGTGRRLIEFGPRGFDVDRTTLRVAAGLDYEMKNGWELSVFYNFGRTDQDQIDDGLVNVERALIALDVELAADGSVQCRSAVARADGCAPYNPFGAGTITPEAINYLKAPGTFQAIVEQENIAITLTGDTSIDLPGGPLAFAVGYEYREEFGFDTPGALSILGAASAPQQGPTSGKFDVDEYFGEVRLPLLENVEVSVAARAGDYSTVGNIGTWMIGIDARIIESLRLRTTYSESVAHPMSLTCLRARHKHSRTSTTFVTI